MEANSFFKKEKGVSAVIGVILMVAITIAIAATVYVYVSQYYGEESLTVEGTVLSVVEWDVYDDPSCAECNDTIYNITLDEDNSYLMMFRTDDAVVPPVDVTIRFYYELVEDYYDVYKIKSL